MTEAGKKPVVITTPVLGTPRIASPLAGFHSGPERVQLALGASVLSDPGEEGDFSFELAGARDAIFFDPSATRCAIVTCGGLCPGINDVIQSIVMSAFNSYGVRSVLGIRYGLKGFFPWGLEPVELTPKNVRHIHEVGGTILGTSRGPQDSGAIVDRLLQLGVSILFMIGGDGTMKAALDIHR
jgi:6-phosphofructokinase 1